MQRTELLEHAIDHANDGIAIMELTDDPEVPVRIVYANESIGRFTGYTNAELLDPSNPLLKVQAENQPLFANLFGEIRAGRAVRFDLELGGKDRSTWVDARWSPLRSKGDTVTHYVAILRDLTEHRAAHAERDILYRTIEASSDYVLLCDATPPSKGGRT